MLISISRTELRFENNMTVDNTCIVSSSIIAEIDENTRSVLKKDYRDIKNLDVFDVKKKNTHEFSKWLNPFGSSAELPAVV